jgi:hypothetical protein
MIRLVVKFCLVLNPYICQTLEMVPDDGHAMASAMECIRGGAIGGMNFTKDHMEWQTRGWRCDERPDVMQSWLATRKGS